MVLGLGEGAGETTFVSFLVGEVVLAVVLGEGVVWFVLLEGGLTGVVVFAAGLVVLAVGYV